MDSFFNADRKVRINPKSREEAIQLSLKHWDRIIWYIVTAEKLNTKALRSHICGEYCALCFYYCTDCHECKLGKCGQIDSKNPWRKVFNLLLDWNEKKGKGNLIRAAGKMRALLKKFK